MLKNLLMHKVFLHLEEYIGAVMLAVMSTVAFANVVVRYCTNFSFSVSEEITVNFFVWVVMLGASRAFREGSHFHMSVLFSVVPQSLKRIMYIFGIICTIVFFLVLAYYGIIEVLDEVDLEVVSESLAIPVWLYTIVTPLLSFVAIIRVLQRAYDDLRQDAF